MAYVPTVWVNDAPPALSATNLNKLTNELEEQALAQTISHTLPDWVNGAPPALTDEVPLNEMERVIAAVASSLGLSYAMTVWENGWIPPRNAARFNKMELQAQANRTAIIGTSPEGTLNVVPASIDNTGVTDVTAQLQSWINSIGNGTVASPQILRFDGGTYRINGVLSISGKSNWIVESSSAVLGGNTTLKHVQSRTFDSATGWYHGDDSKRLLVFTSCTNCTLRYITLQGNDPMQSSPLPVNGMDGYKPWEGNGGSITLQHVHCVQVDKCVNQTIDRVKIYQSGGGDGINWGNQNQGTRSSGTITGCDIRDCHRCAIAVVGGQDTLIIGNTFGRNGFWVIDLEPNNIASGNYRITIDGNTFLSNGNISPTRVSIGAFSGSKGNSAGTDAGACEDLIIRNNVWTSRPVDININQKPYAWAGAPAPYPLRGKRLTITGNSAPVGGDSTEIRLFDTLRISGNSFGPVADPEFNIHSCTDIQITGSTYTQDNNI